MEKRTKQEANAAERQALGRAHKRKASAPRLVGQEPDRVSPPAGREGGPAEETAPAHDNTTVTHEKSPNPEIANTRPMQMIERRKRADGDTEVFACIVWQWDVSQAQEIVRGRTPTDRIPVAETFEAQLKPHLDQIDTEYAMSDAVDLCAPVLMLRHQYKEAVVLLVFDGWHRIYRAKQEGIESLPALVLTPEEERRIRRGSWWDRMEA